MISSDSKDGLSSDIRTMTAASILAVVIVTSSWVSGWVCIQHTNTRINDLKIPPEVFENRVDTNQENAAVLAERIAVLEDRMKDSQ